MIFPFGKDEDGHVQLFVLSAFVIRVHEIGWQSGASLLLLFLLFVRGLVFAGGQEATGVGGTTRGRTAWSFGGRRPSILRVWISHLLYVTSVGGDLRHILASFAHVFLALVRALTFASIFLPIEGFATLLALLKIGADGMFRGIGSLLIGRKHPMILVTMRTKSNVYSPGRGLASVR